MFKNRSCGQWFKWIFLNHEAFSTGSPQEITRGFIVFLLSHLGRFTLLVLMETMLHLHHTHHRSFILRMGSRTPELIRTTTKVKTCTLLVWAQVDDHHCKNNFTLLAGGYAAPGVNHVVIQERQRDNGGDVALGMLAGAATGLALGSLFSVF